LLRTFPAGADGLALRTLQVLSEPKEPDGPKVKMSTVLIALVKSLVAGREKLDPRFMLPILPDLDKVNFYHASAQPLSPSLTCVCLSLQAEVRRQLPRLVGTLSGKPEDREVVRRVFNQILSTAVVPDLPKLRPLDQFTPSELMVLLHHLERDAGLKATMEGESREGFSFCKVRRYLLTLLSFSDRHMLLVDGHLQV
jgi:symplekin